MRSLKRRIIRTREGEEVGKKRTRRIRRSKRIRRKDKRKTKEGQDEK